MAPDVAGQMSRAGLSRAGRGVILEPVPQACERPDASSEKTEAAERSVRDLLHDLRNSLATIKMAVQTLAIGETVSERGRRRMEIALREVDAIDHLLDRLPAAPPLSQVPEVDCTS